MASFVILTSITNLNLERCVAVESCSHLIHFANSVNLGRKKLACVSTIKLCSPQAHSLLLVVASILRLLFKTSLYRLKRGVHLSWYVTKK